MYNVAVLLSVFNGALYLKDQLQSLKKQRKANIKLFVIDDNSTDNSIEIIKNSKINYHIIDQKGFGDPHKNFFYLIKNVPQTYDYYCFCDQDDVWFKNKVIYSINTLSLKGASIIGSRTIHTNKNLKILGRSTYFKKELSMENALVQSICGGNTMLWTNKFQNKVSKLDLSTPASHDWMMYQVAMSLEEKFIYCKRPLILYRQHENNNIGSNVGLKNLIIRIYWGLLGRYKIFHDLNKTHLYNLIEKNYVNKKNMNLIKKFYENRNKNLFSRVKKIIFDLKLYRQTFSGNIMLFIALILKKV